MDVRQAIAAFDGRCPDVLKAAVAAGIDNDDRAVLSAAMTRPEDAVAASWIIKAVLERQAADPVGAPAYFAALSQELPWQAHLHVLQSVRLAPEAATGCADLISRFLTHERALLRVWAMDGFCRLAGLDPSLRAAARSAFSAQSVGGAAAMRARCRNLAAEYPWLQT